MSIAIEPARQPDVERLLLAGEAFARSVYREEECYLLDLAELERPEVTVFVARVDGVAVGMAALVTDELKRVFVDESARGTGIAAQLLEAVESHAPAGLVRLETGVRSAAAIALYEKHGYVHIPRFGQYVDSESSVCMEKRL